MKSPSFSPKHTFDESNIGASLDKLRDALAEDPVLQNTILPDGFLIQVR